MLQDVIDPNAEAGFVHALHPGRRLCVCRH